MRQRHRSDARRGRGDRTHRRGDAWLLISASLLRVRAQRHEPSVKVVIVRQVRKPTVKIKGPGARDGERSFGRHPSNSFTTPDTKRTKGQGPGLVNVLLATTHRSSFTTCGLKGQRQGMVNVLLAASPATRSRPRAIKGQEPGLVDVLLQPAAQTQLCARCSHASKGRVLDAAPPQKGGR